MFNNIINIFRIKELRNRILFTIFILIIFRIGAQIPVPGVNFEALSRFIEAQKQQSTSGNPLFEYFNFFAGGAFNRISIFSLGIMPYITTSIIMQLLLMVFPTFKRMSEEEGGRRKINQFTRVGTVFVCLLQSFMVINQINNFNSPSLRIIAFENNIWLFYLTTIMITTTGTMVLMWLGEKITERGIGNGISLIIFAGIVARVPDALFELINKVKDKSLELPIVLLILGVYCFIIALVIYEQQGQRKIPVNYAKRVVGRKVYGSPSTYLPLKINPSGVIPIIFANAVLVFPQSLTQLNTKWEFLNAIGRALHPDKALYLVLYAALIIAFSYFYTQVQFNPIEIAKNIREHGGSVPGIPINKLEEYIAKVLNRIVLPGSIFLSFIAIIPTIIIRLIPNFPVSFAYLLGGTSLIIIVGVDLDTMSQIESHLKMHYRDGLTKKGKIRSRNF